MFFQNTLNFAFLLVIFIRQCLAANSWVSYYRSRSAICTEKTLCNGDMCAEVCLQGTVEIDPWSNYVLSFQRWLQFNESFIYHEIPGTHNSHISVAYGFGIERDFISALDYGNELTWSAGDLNLGEGVDQYLSITDQFNIGIRHIEIDINWGPWVVNDSSSDADGIVVCHTPIYNPEHKIQLQQYLDQRGLNNTINFSMNHFCCKEQFVSFNDSMNEIKQWLLNDSNSNEFIIVYFDTKWDILEYQAEWGINFLDKIFGDWIFTPKELNDIYNNTWPSLYQLIYNQNKRLLFENVKTGWDEPTNSFIFTPPLWNGFQYGPSNLEIFSTCEINGSETYGKNFTRALDDTITDLNGIDRQYRNIIETSTRCGGNIVSPHMINPTEMYRFIWTFARGEPKGFYNNKENIKNINNNSTCIAMKPSGKWAIKNCNNIYRVACVKITNKQDWYVSTDGDLYLYNWYYANQYPTTVCPDGYTFSIPTDGYQNAKLQVQGLSSYVWINMNILQFEMYKKEQKLSKTKPPNLV